MLKEWVLGGRGLACVNMSAQRKLHVEDSFYFVVLIVGHLGLLWVRVVVVAAGGVVW